MRCIKDEVCRYTLSDTNTHFIMGGDCGTYCCVPQQTGGSVPPPPPSAARKELSSFSTFLTCSYTHTHTHTRGGGGRRGREKPATFILLLLLLCCFSLGPHLQGRRCFKITLFIKWASRLCLGCLQSQLLQQLLFSHPVLRRAWKNSYFVQARKEEKKKKLACSWVCFGFGSVDLANTAWKNRSKMN